MWGVCTWLYAQLAAWSLRANHAPEILDHCLQIMYIMSKTQQMNWIGKNHDPLLANHGWNANLWWCSVSWKLKRWNKYKMGMGNPKSLMQKAIMTIQNGYGQPKKSDAESNHDWICGTDSLRKTMLKRSGWIKKFTEQNYWDPLCLTSPQFSCQYETHEGTGTNAVEQ